MPADFTPEDILRTIETFVAKRKKLPTTSEISEIMDGLDKGKIQPVIMRYMKGLVRLVVLPGGHIRDADGGQVWVKNSAGSLNLARFKKDEVLGNVISQ